MKKLDISKPLVVGVILSVMGATGTVVAGHHEEGEYAKEKRELMKEQRKERRELKREFRAQKMLERVDANKDGVVDLDEYLTHAQNRFSKMDLDSNGVVTPEEAKESMAQMRKEFKEKRKQAMKDKAGE